MVKHRRRRRRRLAWIALALLAASVVWILPRPRWLERWPPPDNRFESWRPLFVGVDYARGHFSNPRRIKAHVIRVDLRAPGVEFLVKPAEGHLPDETRSQFASSFLRRHHLQVAVSSSAFTPFVKMPGRAVNVVGLAVSQGDRYSEAATNLDALVITRDNQARFVPAGGDTRDAWNGVGGNLITLRGGEIVAEDLRPDAASVVGLSGDRRYLYWLIVDGRQPGYSEGASAAETAAMMRQVGASEALNMDGGSVCTIAIDSGWRGARVRNRPCHPLLAGWQRPIGGLVGIRAQKLP